MKKSLLIKRVNSRPTSLIKRFIPVLGLLIMAYFLYLAIPSLINNVVKIAWYPFDTARIWLAESSNSLPQYIRNRSALIAELDNLKIKVKFARLPIKLLEKSIFYIPIIYIKLTS